MGKPFFLSLDSLQVGSYLDNGGSIDDGWVKILPINSIRPVLIEGVDLSTNNFKSVSRVCNSKGTFDEVKVLVTGPGGQCRFLEDFLGFELPSVLRILKEQREELATQRAAMRTKEREIARGETEQVRKIARQMSIVEGGRRPREEYRRGRRRWY